MAPALVSWQKMPSTTIIRRPPSLGVEPVIINQKIRQDLTLDDSLLNNSRHIVD